MKELFLNSVLFFDFQKRRAFDFEHSVTSVGTVHNAPKTNNYKFFLVLHFVVRQKLWFAFFDNIC